MRGRQVFHCLALLAVLLSCRHAGSRLLYPVVTKDSDGTWIATDYALIDVVGDLWLFYTRAQGLCSDRVLDIVAGEREIWAATKAGLARMDRSSRRWECLHPPELPSDIVYAVAADDRYLWVGTSRGAARFDLVERTWQRLGRGGGPRDVAVHHVFPAGRTVWFATDRGVFRFDRITGVWRRYGPNEGFVLGPVYEIRQVGQSLLFLCAEGLVRYDIRGESVFSFGRGQGLDDPVITAFAAVQGEIWLGTRSGIFVYSSSTDSLSPFLYEQGMPPGPVVGMEVALPYVWVATSRGLGRFNTIQKSWELKRPEDGLHPARIEGLATAGQTLVVLHAGLLQGYQVQRDDWVNHSLEDILAGRAGGRREPSAWSFNLEFTASGEASFEKVDGNPWFGDGQIVPAFRLGAGRSMPGGRSLDLSAYLDLGDATRSGIRDYDAELRFRGGPNDSLRELLLSDEVPVRPDENTHQLTDDAWLEGLGLRQEMGRRPGRKVPALNVEAEAGLRRGARVREFFRGSIELNYPLAHGYITPGSDVVRVDGMVLERGVDYLISHTTGQLTFLNPDVVNALSLIEVTYTYELIPRKTTTGSTILEMLPRDNELGGFVRAGTAVYVTDETGLYRQIDGAAPKYIDRGWVESVFQKYTQGSLEVELQIHDMGTEQNARDIFDYDRPVSYIVLFEDPHVQAILDESLASGYEVKMQTGKFYVQISIDEKSRSAEILVGLFAQTVHARSDLAASVQDMLRPLVGRLHVGLAPWQNAGFGAGYLGSRDLEDPDVTARTALLPESYELGTVDGWTNWQLGTGRWGGRLSGMYQLARSRWNHDGGTNLGYGASGNLVYNSEALGLRLDGEYHSRDFKTLGNRRTVLGTLEGEFTGDVTLQPWSWMNARLFYDHQRSYQNAGGTAGTVENLLGKFSVNKDRWPSVWILAARSRIDGLEGSDGKLRFAGNLEYDLARGILEFVGMRKLAIKAYYDYSSNEVTAAEGATSGPFSAPAGSATNMRLELKAAPTKTEDGYVRFERKHFAPERQEDRPLDWWELVAGATSRYLEVLVPSFNGKLTHYRATEAVGDSLADVERAQALLSGQLDFFPGQLFDSMSDLVFGCGYGYSNYEEARNRAMQAHSQKHHVEGRLTWGRYDGPLRLETRGKWWRTTEDENQVVRERYFEMLNRFTWRPLYVSPITLRLDYSRLEQRPPETELAGVAQNVFPSLEWEMRWSNDLVTRIRLEAPLELKDDFYDSQAALSLSTKQWSLRPWAEARLSLRRFALDSLLRIIARASFAWKDWFDRDFGAERAWEASAQLWLDWEKAGSFIVRLGLSYNRHDCVERAGISCEDTTTVEPTLNAIARF